MLDRWGSPCSLRSAAPERSAGHQPRRGWRPLERPVRLVAGQGLRQQRDRTRGDSLVCATCRDVSQLNQQCHAASLAYGVSHALTKASIYRTFNLSRRPAQHSTRSARWFARLPKDRRPESPTNTGHSSRPNACVQRRRSEAQGTNPAGVGVRWNAQLGWWQDKDCADNKPAHEATA